MLTITNLLNFSNKLQEALTLELKYQRTEAISKLLSKYQTEFDIFFSFASEISNSFSFSLLDNKTILFDFKKDFGLILYYYLNKDYKRIIKELKNFHYDIQFLFYACFTNYFTKKLGNDFILTNIKKYYSLSELINIVEFPIDNIDEIGEINIKNKVLISYPLDLYRVPTGFKFVKLAYFIKKNGKIVSNIKQQTIRQELNSLFNLQNISVVGVLLKDKKYKKKYSFQAIYINKDVKQVSKLFKGKATVNEIEIFLQVFKQSKNIIYSKPFKKFESKNDLKEFLSKQKSKTKFILLSNTILEFKPKVIYKTAKIVDYIYNDVFDIIGLKVSLDNVIYDLKFNVENTDYIYSIEDRFVKVSVTMFEDEILKVAYNSSLPLWHHKYSYCSVCGGNDYKHKVNGVCYSCYNWLNSFTKNLSGIKEIKKEVYRDTKYINNNVEISIKDNKIILTPLSGYQLHLPFEG